MNDADEPQDRIPDFVAPPWWEAADARRPGSHLRHVAIGVGAAVVVLIAGLAFAMTASRTGPAAPAARAVPVPQPSDISSDSSDVITVGSDPGCSPGQSAVLTLLNSLTSDVSDKAKTAADVQAAARGVAQASAAARSTAVKQALDKTATDISALGSAADPYDLAELTTALDSLSSDVGALYAACAG